MTASRDDEDVQTTERLLAGEPVADAAAPAELVALVATLREAGRGAAPAPSAELARVLREGRPPSVVPLARRRAARPMTRRAVVTVALGTKIALVSAAAAAALTGVATLEPVPDVIRDPARELVDGVVGVLPWVPEAPAGAPDGTGGEDPGRPGGDTGEPGGTGVDPATPGDAPGRSGEAPGRPTDEADPSPDPDADDDGPDDDGPGDDGPGRSDEAPGRPADPGRSDEHRPTTAPADPARPADPPATPPAAPPATPGRPDGNGRDGRSGNADADAAPAAGLGSGDTRAQPYPSGRDGR